MPKRTTRPVDSVEFNGIIFRRYPESKTWAERAYFTPGGIHRSQGVGRLHRELWKAANGPIPDGHDIHHRDGNPLNNDLSNLQCLTEKEHYAAHAITCRPEERQRRCDQINKVRHLAAAWHRTDEGRAWHVEHGKQAYAERQPRSFVCERCGASFESTKRGVVRFCRLACKAAARRAAGVDDVVRACKRCGVEFSVNRYSKVGHCSRLCAQRGRREA